MSEEEDEQAGAGWIVSFADLMTLLFAAFVVLYGLKPEGIGDAIKVITATAAIRETFNETPDEIPADDREGPTVQGQAVFEFFKGDTPNKPVIKKSLRTENVLNIINEDMKRIKRIIDLKLQDETTPSARKQDSNMSQQGLSVHRDTNGYTVRMVSSYFYKPGTYRVKREDLWKIKLLGEAMKDHGRTIRIEGHTDNVPQRGQYSNWEISSLRAGFLARYFTKELEFQADRIKVAGLADTKPLADNDIPEGRRMNRRVEIKVEYDE